MPLLRVCLVLDAGNRDWILGKFADRLAENLAAWNVVAEIAEAPSPDADINHWMFYGHAWGHFFQEKRRKLSPSTVTVTHLDDPIKVKMLREVLAEVADVGICLSRMTQDDLSRRGFASHQLCFVTPGHDGTAVPRRISIAITSRVYPDGRKREHLLVELARTIRLDAFHFEIVGSGWEKVIPHLEAAGATVTYHPGTSDYRKDYENTLDRLRSCDFYLYLGLDEGSMGLLDALASGIETIVTRQGFHLDIPGGITHGFLDNAELVAIFRGLANQRDNLVNSVKELTWGEYARQHSVIWRCLAEGRLAEIAPALHPPGSVLGASMPNSAKAPLGLRYFLNALRSDFLMLYLARRKWEIRAALSKVKRRLLRR